MRRVDEVIDDLLNAGGGALRVHDHPTLRRSIQRRLQAGALTTVWPGVVVHPADLVDVDVRIRAAHLWRPDAVMTGATAARLTYWPQIPVRSVTLSSLVKVSPRRGYRVGREQIPPDLVTWIAGLPVTVPALTALDLVSTLGGSGTGIDEALRRRACTLQELHEALALTSGRSGNALRRTVLHESRAEPWSEAERRLHVLLRRARVGGWVTNHPVRVGTSNYLLDVSFVAERVAIEVDGFAAHTTRAQFHRDRRKWTDLGAAGWLVVHVSWEQLVEDPSWVLSSLAAIRALARSHRK